MAKRKTFTAAFKSRVTKEALRGDRTVQQIAAKHGVHPNQASQWNLMPAVNQLRRRFGLTRVVLVGDRGMLVQTQIAKLRQFNGIDWISALRSGAIRKLQRASQLDRSDEVGLFEILQHPDFPGERLVACRNPRLAVQRAHTRESLLQATEALLEPIRASVAAGHLQGAAEIGLRVGQVRNHYKVAKHFACDISDDRFEYRREQARIDSEAALDGVYIIRTSLPAEDLSAADCVRSYKALTRVERAFRTLKTDDLQVRPIRHRLGARARPHLPVHAGLLSGVAHARGVAPAAVRRRGTGRTGPHARSGRSGGTLRQRATQESHPPGGGWVTVAQLPDPAGGSRRSDAQLLPHQGVGGLAAVRIRVGRAAQHRPSTRHGFAERNPALTPTITACRQ
ncbi:MAG: transposase [Bryobacterales bacterium]|nr:transposase [Bryobacterales bacterium]